MKFNTLSTLLLCLIGILLTVFLTYSTVEAFITASTSVGNGRSYKYNAISDRKFGMDMKLPLVELLLHETSGSNSVESTSSASSSSNKAEEENNSNKQDERTKLELFLERKYPSFYKLMNKEMTKVIQQGTVTVFVPNESAFAALGEKKQKQIDDPRNSEIREKMGSYHIIPGEAISAIELRTEDWTKGRPKDGSKPNTLIAGIVTLSGEVPVGRSKSGGILGWGAKEDGDIVIGPDAKIVQSFNVEGSFVHEMDSLISPLVLWRYCDQLRIPGF